MSRQAPGLEMLGIRFAGLDAAGALAEVERLVEREAPGFVVHANVHTVNLATADPSYAEVLRRADLVLNDGKGVMLGARIKGERFPMDLNGNMFTPLLLELAAQRGWSVFFFGAKPGVAERAAEVVRRSIQGLEIAGTRNGYFTTSEEDAVVADIKAAAPDIVLVGLGNPRQEQWLDRNLAATGAKLGVGIGAFFDFQTGEVKRAPDWMNRAGLEWVHRLAAEPKRMWRRYLVGNPQFLARVAKERKQVPPGGRSGPS